MSKGFAIKNNDLTVIVPIFNEADSLNFLLPDLIQESKEKGWQVILVNDGSTDNTAQILAEYKNIPCVRIIEHKVNRGYGGALKSGIRNSNTSHVITIDGDGQHSIADINKIYQFALENNADLVVGKRESRENASHYRTLGKWLIRNIAKIFMPLPIQDLNSGLKIYRTELVRKYLPLCPNSMAFSDIITLIFVNQSHLVLELPISIQKRRSGKSTIGFGTAVETVIEIINLIMLFNPLKIFLPVSTFCFLVGIGWGLPLIFMGRGVSVGAMLAIVLGGIFFAIGLIASQLCAIRMSMIENSHPRGEFDDRD